MKKKWTETGEKIETTSGENDRTDSEAIEGEKDETDIEEKDGMDSEEKGRRMGPIQKI